MKTSENQWHRCFFIFLTKAPTVLMKWSDNCICFCNLTCSEQKYIRTLYQKMKKNSSLLPFVVVAGLGAGLVAGCCSCRTEVSGPAPITVYAPAINSSGSIDTCPGSFSGYINYTQAPPAWGWAPVKGATNYSASNGGQCSGAKIEFIGLYGDTGCNVSNVVIPNPPMSPMYIFTVYLPSNTPTTNYPIILNGF